MKSNVLIWISALSVGSAIAVQPTLTGRSEAGFVMSRGNTNTETANARINVVKESDKWRHLFDVTGLYGRTTEAEIAARWNFLWQTDRRFDTDAYWFGSLRYDGDRFSGFDYQSTLSAGAGHEFINSNTTRLHAQIGIGYRRLRSERLTFNPAGIVIDRVKGEQQSSVVTSGAVNFERAFNDSTKLIDTLSIETGSSNTLTRNELALQVKMNQVLALSVGLSVRKNTNPPPPLRQQDTLTTVNLVYERKR